MTGCWSGYGRSALMAAAPAAWSLSKACVKSGSDSVTDYKNVSGKPSCLMASRLVRAAS